MGIVTTSPASNLVCCKHTQRQRVFPGFSNTIWGDPFPVVISTEKREAKHRSCHELPTSDPRAAAATAWEVLESLWTFWRIFAAAHFCGGTLLPRPCQPASPSIAGEQYTNVISIRSVTNSWRFSPHHLSEGSQVLFGLGLGLFPPLLPSSFLMEYCSTKAST